MGQQHSKTNIAKKLNNPEISKKKISYIFKNAMQNTDGCELVNRSNKKNLLT